jgi:hypothetical protein
VDRLKCVALEFTFSRHCKSPSSRSLESIDSLGVSSIRQSATYFAQLAEPGQFIVLNIGSIPLSEQVLINPIVTCSRQNDGAVLILPDPLLKNTAVQVISLSQDDLPPVRRSE